MDLGGPGWTWVDLEEEEEERLPRSHGRWALASSPGGPAQTSQGSPNAAGLLELAMKVKGDRLSHISSRI